MFLQVVSSAFLWSHLDCKKLNKTKQQKTSIQGDAAV